MAWLVCWPVNLTITSLVINRTPCARLLLRHPLAQRIPTEACECSVSVIWVEFHGDSGLELFVESLEFSNIRNDVRSRPLIHAIVYVLRILFPTAHNTFSSPSKTAAAQSVHHFLLLAIFSYANISEKFWAHNLLSELHCTETCRYPVTGINYRGEK